MKWLTNLPNTFNKKVTWLKINEGAVSSFWCSTDLYPYHQIQEPKICMKIGNGVLS